MNAGVPLVGRSAELAAVIGRLRGNGRCTIVGPGGVGKSALARAVGGACGRPIVWVDAEPIESIAGLTGAILAALDPDVIAGVGSYRRQADLLADRQVVLVLDGVEHLDGVSDAIEGLPSRPDGAWLLVTTRRSPAPTPVLRLQPLSTEGNGAGEDRGGDAGRLLHELLDALGEPTVVPPDRLAELARETGGLPLAIELLARRLAFGRTRPSDAGDGHRLDTTAGADLTALDPVLAASVLRSINLVDDVAAHCFRHLGLTASLLTPADVAGLAGCGEELAFESLRQLREVGLVLSVRDRFEVLPPIRDAALAFLRHSDSFEADLDRALTWASGVLGCSDHPGASLDLDNHLRLGRLAVRHRRPGVLPFIAALAGSLHRHMRDGEILSLVDAALAVPGADPAEEAAVARQAALAAAGSMSSHNAQRWLDRSSEAARRARNPPALQCRIESTRALLAMDVGDLTAARTAAELGVRLAEDCGEEIYAWASRHHLAVVALQAGRLDRCEALAEGCAEWGRRHDPDLAQLGAVELAWAGLERGRWADAAAQARRLRNEILEQVGCPTEVSVETLSIELLAAPGDAVADFEDDRNLPWWPRLTRRIAEASALPVDRWREALHAAADVVAIADAHPLVYPGVGARLLLGDAALAGGELRQTQLAYEQALRAAMSAGYRLRAADALDGLAALATAVDDHRSAQLATGLANWIRDWCGAYPWPRPMLPSRPTIGDEPSGSWVIDGLPTERGVEAVLARLRKRLGNPADEGAPWSSLTKRERVVADLAARGVSNGEIADTLFVSRRTVESHLQRVYQKLDLHSRTELAYVRRPNASGR